MTRFFDSFEQAILAAQAGMAGFVWFWILLTIFAALELISPGRKACVESGPRIRVNFTLGICNAAIVMLPFFSVVALAVLAERECWGVLNRIAAPDWAVFIVGFLLFDLGFYLRHRVEHSWALWWRFHRVHHSDADLDLSTNFRTHPVDAVFGVAFNLVIIRLCGISPAAVAAHILMSQLVMAWGHTNLHPRPRLSRRFGWLVVTPDFHARHHSAAQAQTDSNFGIVLTVWDRLFGTISSANAPVTRFGLGQRFDEDAANLAAQLKLPFVPHQV
jgi:sterol desaturase/sphingolipid hydroxylase (fatty acid hydroxylase superfamily)